MANPFDYVPTAVRPGNPIMPQLEDLRGLQESEREEIKKQELEDNKKLNEIKSLKNHPGWKQIKDDILDKRITAYASGEAIRPLTTDPKITDAELGAFLRKSMDVADELQLIVSMIENA